MKLNEILNKQSIITKPIMDKFYIDFNKSAKDAWGFKVDIYCKEYAIQNDLKYSKEKSLEYKTSEHLISLGKDAARIRLKAIDGSLIDIDYQLIDDDINYSSIIISGCDSSGNEFDSPPNQKRTSDSIK